MASLTEFRQLWRGLKRLILTGGSDPVTPVGEASVLTGRAAIVAVGERLGVRGAGSRGELATAAGLALSGLRATTWLTDLDPTLALAVSQRLPLVAHVALGDASGPGAGSTAGQAAYQAAVQAGWTVLHPQSVQEAVDLTLAAHHLAEHALTPVLVAVDTVEIEAAIEDVLLPDRELCHRIAGAPDDSIDAPTPAQELLFGNARRRLPRYFDLDRPSLHGARDAGLGAISGQMFFDHHGPEQLLTSLRQVGELTGRPLTALHESTADSATPDGWIVARGAAVRLAEAVATELRKTAGIDFRVLGLRCSIPEVRDAVASRVRHPQPTIWLTPAADRTAPDQAGIHLLPTASRGPSAHYGFPEHPLRATDLLAYCREVHGGRRSDVCLGLSSLAETADYPKREILLQALRRDYGDLVEYGLRSTTVVDLRGQGATTIAVCRSAPVGGEEFLPGLAGVLGEALGAGIRSRINQRAGGYGVTLADYLTVYPRGSSQPCDTGADLPVDALVLLDDALPGSLDLADGAVVIVPLASDAGTDLESMPAATLAVLRQRRVRLFVIRTGDRPAPHESALPEQILGAVCGALQTHGLELKTTRAVHARERALAHLPDHARTARIEAFERGFSSIQEVDQAALDRLADRRADRQDDDLENREVPVPGAVRHLEGGGNTFDSVPRFWDQVGVQHRHGQADTLCPDPFQATAALPPLTATFHDLSSRRQTIRVFEPEQCTGCGDCWTVCPDTALGPAVYRFEDLLTTGMVAARESGHNADALRPMIGKIAARAKKIAGDASDDQADGQTGTTAGPILRAAFDYVIDKAAPAEARRQSLTAAFELVCTHLEDLPIARAQPFFEHGELLTIAVHVEACKACGACTKVCATDAIIAAPQTPARIASARKNWRLFEQLPDTAEATIARATADDAVGPAAALLLDQHCMFTLSGGDPAEPGSGEKIAVHLALAAAEHHQRPHLQLHLAAVTDLERQFATRIRDLLADALPAKDLAGLEASLDDLGGRHLDLAALTKSVEERGTRTPVDATLLRTLVHTARELGDLRTRLAVGRSGLGRARVGLLVASGTVATWAAAFPYNPFPIPVVADRAGATAELAKGLCRGQIETALEDIRLLRRARLELARPVEAEQARAELAGLTWHELSAEERAICPPLLLVGGDDSLGQRGLTELAKVLTDELPIKLLVLTGLDLGLADESGLGRDGSANDTPHSDIGLIALAHRRAFVLQSSIGDPDHLVGGCLGAFAHDGPALLHVHAPSPQRHGFATDQTFEQGRRALAAAVLPQFTYDPAAAGLFGRRLTLQGDPDPDHTLAHFAVTQGRFASHFTALADDAPAPTALLDYLALAPSSRAACTPILDLDGQRLRVSEAMAQACEDRCHTAQVLQELAGVVTPFTEQIEAEVTARTAADHQHELTTQRHEFEAKLASLSSELQQEFTIRLRDRLVELAERHRQPTATNSTAASSTAANSTAAERLEATR